MLDYATNPQCIQGESFLFKIHRYFLARESPFLSVMFGLPPVEGSVEGLDDYHPIHLNGLYEARLVGGASLISDEEFADFLRFLYYG